MSAAQSFLSLPTTSSVVRSRCFCSICSILASRPVRIGTAQETGDVLAIDRPLLLRRTQWPFSALAACVVRVGRATASVRICEITDAARITDHIVGLIGELPN